MPKLSAYTLGSTTAKQVSRLATANTGMFNIMDPPFNASGDPGTMDTAALIAVRDAALATSSVWGSKGVYIPPGCTVRFDTPVDFRGISNIQCDGYLLFIGPMTAPILKFGAPSQGPGIGRYIINGALANNEGYAAARYPLIQFAGLRGAYVRLGQIPSFVEIAAEPGPYESTAYTQFNMGSTWRLELRSAALPQNATSGWINSNQFLGGSMAQLRIGGPWVFVDSIVSTTVTTTTPHNFATGELVEMYNGTIGDGSFQLVTVTGANTFTVPLTWAGAANPGNGWRVMGRSGYPHNDNTFYNPNIEDGPAIVHIQGQMNRLLQARTEATGPLQFAPHVFGNFFESSNTSHGYEPEGDDFKLTVTDHNPGRNYWGWVQPPRSYNSTQGRQKVIVDATSGLTLKLKDENALIMMTSASANTVTLPTDFVAFAIGSRVDVVMAGAGQTSFVAAVGATIEPAATLKIDGQYTKVSVTKTAADTWLLTGKIMA